MSLVLVAAAPAATRRAPRRTHWLPCPECANTLDVVGELDGCDVSHCSQCDRWWIDDADDDTRARRALATWRPYDEPEPIPAPFFLPERIRGDDCYQLPLLGGGRVG